MLDGEGHLKGVRRSTQVAVPLSPTVSRRRKPERGTSGGRKRSAHRARLGAEYEKEPIQALASPSNYTSHAADSLYMRHGKT